MKEKKKRTGLVVFITIIIAAIISGLTIWGIITSNNNSNNSQTTIFTRDAKNSDIYIDMQQDLFNETYSLTPYVDINNLQITFTYLDENHVKVKEKTKNIGNVKKNAQYSVSISTSDFSLTEMWKIKYVQYGVSGGTVLKF